MSYDVKIMSMDSMLLRLVTTWSEESIVFTNGCFDVLHPGHLFYLEVAASMGDRLIVGMNSDSSVRKLKGEGRPIHDQVFRSKMLEGLGCVDAVVIFDESNPLKIIKNIVAELGTRSSSFVLVKGGDYKEKDIVGAKLVQSKSGLVKTVPLVDDYSSTSIIEKIRKGIK